MHLVFIAALFTIAKIRKQPKSISTEDWIKKMWCIYTPHIYIYIYIWHICGVYMYGVCVYMYIYMVHIYRVYLWGMYTHTHTMGYYSASKKSEMLPFWCFDQINRGLESWPGWGCLFWALHSHPERKWWGRIQALVCDPGTHATFFHPACPCPLEFMLGLWLSFAVDPVAPSVYKSPISPLL